MAKALPRATLGVAHSASILMANSSLPSAFCLALGKDFAECYVGSQKKKVEGRPSDGDEGFAECHDSEALGKDQVFAERR